MPHATEHQPRNAFQRLFAGWEARDWAPLVSLGVLVVFFSFASPGFFHPSTIVMVLKLGAVLAIVSVGLTFVLLCAEIDLSVGMMALWSASMCGWLFTKWAYFTWWLGENWVGLRGLEWDGPPLFDEANYAAGFVAVAMTVLLPLVCCLLMGLLTGALTVWARLPSFIISLAMMFVAEGASKYLLQSKQHAVPHVLYVLGNRGLEIGGVTVLPYNALLAGVVMLAGHVVLQHTRFGRYVTMTGGNREAARLAGVRTGRIVTACLAICALTAAVAGMVNAGRMGNVTIDQNQPLLLQAVACVVLGGTSLFGGEGSMGKTLVGVLTFTVLTLGLMQINWINDLARQLLTGVVLLVALVINGLLARKT